MTIFQFSEYHKDFIKKIRKAELRTDVQGERLIIKEKQYQHYQSTDKHMRYLIALDDQRCPVRGVKAAEGIRKWTIERHMVRLACETGKFHK